MTADYTYRSFINADPQSTWDVMTDPAKTPLFFYGTRVDCTWQAGASMNYYHGDSDELASTGEILNVDAPNSYECLFHAQWDPELSAEGPVREIWRLDDTYGITELTVELYDSPPGSLAYESFSTGFPYIISGLKSVVETGSGLPDPS